MNRIATLCFTVLVGVGVFEECLAEDMSFQNALDILLKQSTEIREAQLNFEASSDAYDQSLEAFLPSVSAASSLGRKSEFEKTAHSNVLEMNLNLFRFGGDASALNARKYQNLVNRLQFESIRNKKSWDYAFLLLKILGNKQDFEAQKTLLSLKTASLEATKKLYARGSRPLQDVERLQLDVLSEEERVSRLCVAYEESLAEWHRLIPEATLSSVWPWTTQLSTKQLLRWRGMLEKAKHDELDRAEFNVISKQSVLREKKSLWLPSLDAQGRYGFDRYIQDEYAWKRSWSAALVLSVPLYQNGLQSLAVRDAKRELEKAQIERDSKKRELGVDRESTLKVLEAAIKSLETRDTITKRAKLLYEQSLSAFTRGVLSVNDLIADQTRLARAEQDAGDSKSHAHQSLVKYCRAIGMDIGSCLGAI